MEGDMVNRWLRQGQAGFRDLRLHVQLVDIEPPIWRRLQVADSVSLPQLHRVLQASFGWQDRHLHQFCVGTVCFGEPDDEFEPPLISERSVRLYQLLKNPGDRLKYEYDFGDGWEHEIVLEEMVASEETVSVIRCLAGERAGPLEDCGGSGGFQELLGALSDAEHPQHQELKRWAGKYDPARFDVDAINQDLAKLPKVRRPASGR